jgi:dTDP-4-amino-4,6-dideoxygalactose transaminase
MRTYGWTADRTCVGPGSNHRLDEIQAAILRVLLPHLDRQNEARVQLAAGYRSKLVGTSIGLPPEDSGAVYHQFAVTVDHRDDVRSEMALRGIETGIHYPLGVHRHPRFVKPAITLPVTDELSEKLISLPIQPEVASNHTDEICRALLDSVSACRS